MQRFIKELFQALLLRRFQRFRRWTAGEDVLHLQFAEVSR
jgi:hypothetical protein